MTLHAVDPLATDPLADPPVDQPADPLADPANDTTPADTPPPLTEGEPPVPPVQPDVPEDPPAPAEDAPPAAEPEPEPEPEPAPHEPDQPAEEPAVAPDEPEPAAEPAAEPEAPAEGGEGWETPPVEVPGEGAPTTVDDPGGDPVTPNETADQPAAEEPAASEETASGTSSRDYALLEGVRLRDVLEAAVDEAGGTLTAEGLASLIDNDPEKFRERFFRVLDPVNSINQPNAVRALHKRESAGGAGKRKAHLGVFPLHYWKPKTYEIGIDTTVSVNVVDDED